MSDRIDLAIVGGGPAGMAAAEAAVEAGLVVAIVDEQQRLGGQILRQPPASFRVGNWLPGRGYRAVKAQLARAETLPVRFLAGMSVHSVYRGPDSFELQLAGPCGAVRLDARRLLIATGCYDMPVAFPGWTLPGVTSAGAVQAFVKAQQILPGDRFVLTGTHPLQIILADQIVKGGGRVAAVLFAQPASRALGLLRAPFTALAHAKMLAAAGAAMARLASAGVPIRFGQTVIAAEGNDRVEAAAIAQVADSAPGEMVERIACDAIATCFGFIPQSDLPRALGAEAIAVSRTGGWCIAHDAWMRSGVEGLFVAGEVTGVAGAEVAMIEGRLAGLGIACDAGCIPAEEAERFAQPLRRRLAFARRFAELLETASDPSPIWRRLATSDTILCRCEDLTRSVIVDVIAAHPEAGADAIKRLTRAGMGRCQGRGCEHQVLAMMAHDVPRRFEARMPVRPTPIEAIVEAARPR
jgi:thioredoxin reductase